MFNKWLSVHSVDTHLSGTVHVKEVENLLYPRHLKVQKYRAKKSRLRVARR